MLIRLLSSISRWDESKTIHRTDATICGDAITDLRTTDNRISVWKADTDEDIDDAMVAMALNRDNASKMVCLLLNEDDLKELDIDVMSDEEGKADGLMGDILQKHRDLVEIDYLRLGSLAELMIGLAKKSENRKELTGGQVKNLLNDYKKKKKIDVDSINKKLKDNLKW